MSEPGRRWLWRAYIKLKEHVADEVGQFGVTAASHRAGVSRTFAEYSFRKSIDPDFHPDTQGGARNTLLDDTEETVAEYLLWLEVQTNPARRASEFARALQLLAVPVNVGWVRRVFKRWRFTFKNVRWRSPDKYSISNILNYAAYCDWFTTTILSRCKFLDEAHFQRGGAKSCLLWLCSCCACVCRFAQAARLRSGRPSARSSRHTAKPENVLLRDSCKLARLMLLVSA